MKVTEFLEGFTVNPGINFYSIALQFQMFA